MNWRRAWLVPEGWYYIAVLSFIFGGAVLRNVNLLVALAGLMLAPVLINWRLAVTSLRGLQLRRRLPPRATAGEPATIELELVNRRWFFASWLITIDDQLAHHAALGPERGFPTLSRSGLAEWWRRLFTPRSHADAVVQRVPPRGAALTSYQVVISRRGRYRFGPATLSTRYPLGLVACAIQAPHYDDLLVWPWLGKLAPDWLELIGGAETGAAESASRQGFTEGDYYGLRPWRSGDSRRWIHWRTTARMKTPMVRQFERREEREAALALDAWLPTAPTVADHQRLEAAISCFATAVEELVRLGGGRIGVAVAGLELRSWCGSASSLRTELFDHLAELPGVAAPPVAAAIGELQRLTPHAPQVLVISPRSRELASDIGAPGETLAWLAADDPKFSRLYALR